MNQETRFTLLLTRPILPAWTKFKPDLAHISALDIFLLDEATLLLDHPLADLPPGRRIYCAHSHARQAAGKTTGTFSPGGLANLGEMIRDSHGVVSLPRHHAGQVKAPGPKNLAVMLAQGDEPRRLEGLRLACGLAGCGHRIALLGIDGFQELARTEASIYLEFLPALGVTCHPCWHNALPAWEAILEL